MEVFDSQALTISKVLDGQNTWVQIPFQSYAETSYTCTAWLEEEKALAFLGGLNMNPTRCVFGGFKISAIPKV